MAQITESGGKRSLNPEVNLVPFIDLLSCCICFLLIAAVWLQVGAVQVKQEMGTEAPDAANDTFELVVSLEGPLQAKLQLMQGRREVMAADAAGLTKAEFAAALASQLDAVVNAVGVRPAGQPGGAGAITAATLHPVKGAPYGSLILAMDALRKHQIVNLAVAPKAG